MKKDVREKAIPEEGASAQDESNSKTENEGKQDKRYILFIGKTCVILPDVYVLSRPLPTYGYSSLGSFLWPFMEVYGYFLKPHIHR